MVEIIRENRGPTFAEKFGSAVGKGVEGGSQLYQAYQQKQRFEAENKALEDMGINLRGIQDPEMRKKIVELSLKGELANQQKSTSINSALQAIEQLEGLSGKSGIGLTGQLNPFSGARENRGEFESAKAGILPMFKALFPRGFTEREFKVISDKWLPKSSDTEATIKGKLKGLRAIAQRGQEGASIHEALAEANQEIPMEEKDSGGSEKFLKMRDPEGNLRRVSSKQVKAAKKAGYKVIK